MQSAVGFEKMQMRARSVEVVDLRGRPLIFYGRKDDHTGCGSLPCTATRQPSNMETVACINPLCRPHASDTQGRRIATASTPLLTTGFRCAPQLSRMPTSATLPTAAAQTGFGSPPRPAHLPTASRADRGS